MTDAEKIEAAIRQAANKPTGELTKVDLEKVTWLNFSGYQLTDVSALAGLKQLERLHLLNNQLTDVNALVGLKQLTDLNLNGNRLIDASSLAGLTQLKYLFLQDNPDLIKVEIAKLRVALPKCKIEHNAKN